MCVCVWVCVCVGVCVCVCVCVCVENANETFNIFSLKRNVEYDVMFKMTYNLCKRMFSNK